MRTFKEFFKFEWSRFLCKRNLVIFGILFLFALGLTQYGVFHYNNILEEKENFRELEKERFDSVFSYKFYGTYGFRLTVVPAPFYIFVAKSSPFNNMTTDIDTSERLPIEDSLQAGNAFRARKAHLNDFSSLMLYLGMLLALLFGMEMLLNVEYMKILASVAGHWKVFFNMVLARAVLLGLIYTFMLVSAYLLTLVNGIYIPLGWVPLFFLLLIVVTGVFFFSLGALLGAMRSKVSGLLIGLFLWFVLISLVPSSISSIVEVASNSMESVNKVNLEKYRRLNKFQSGYRKDEGVLKPGESPSKEGSEKVLSFWRNEYKKMMEKDAEMIRKTEKNASLFQWLSSIFPTSNFVSSIYECGSSGYNGLVEYSWFAHKIKMLFNEEFFKIVFVLRKSNETVKPFLKDGENVFPLKTRVPRAAVFGLILTLIYIVILLMFTYKGFKKELLRLQEKQEHHFDGEEHTLGKNKFWPFTIQGDIFGRQLYNIFSGRPEEVVKKGYELTFTFKPEGLVTKGKKSDFLYLSHIKKIPGFFKVGAFVSLLMRLAGTGKERKEEIVSKYDLNPLWDKTFGELQVKEAGRVFMAMLHIRDFEIYLVDDVVDDMPLTFAKELKDDLTALAEKQKAMVILNTDENYLEKRKKLHGRYYNLSHIWLTHLDELVQYKDDIDDVDS